MAGSGQVKEEWKREKRGKKGLALTPTDLKEYSFFHINKERRTISAGE